MRPLVLGLAALVLATAGCGAPQRVVPDAALGDAALGDAGVGDAARVDGAAADASTPDAAPGPDTGLDASSTDAATTSPDAAADCTPVMSASTLGTAVFAGSTAAADDTPRTSDCPDGGPDVLLAWTAPSTGYFRFDTISSSFDTVLSVRRSCAGPEVACNDDGIGIRSSLTLDVAAGETLLLTLDGATSTSSGNYSVDVTEVTGPQCDAPGYSCHGVYSGWRVGYVADSATACDAPFADEPYRLFDAADLVPGAQSCRCECGGAHGGGCVSQLGCDLGAACVAGGEVALGSSSCIPMSFAWDTTYACSVTAPVPAGTGLCDSSVVEATHETPTWSPSAHFCASPASPTACTPFSATACEPRVPSPRTECIAQSGTHGCPTPYAQRTLYQGGLFTDTRRCDAGSCNCGLATVTSCTCPPSGCFASFYTSDFCSAGALVASALAETCSSVHWLSSVHSGRASLTGATPVLDPCATLGSPAPTGNVQPVPENVVTVCCKVVD